MHGGIGKFRHGRHSHLAKPSLATSGPEVHKRKSKKEPSYEPPNGVRGMKMFKRGRIYTNEDVNDRELSKVEIVLVVIGGKEMTDLEILKTEDQDLLARKMMRHHQQNSLQRSRSRGSGGDLTPIWQTGPLRAQNPPIATGTL